MFCAQQVHKSRIGVGGRKSLRRQNSGPGRKGVWNEIGKGGQVRGDPSDPPRSGSSQTEQCTYIVTGRLLKSATL